MKKITFLLIILMGFLVSCTKDFEDFNTDKKSAVEAPGEFLFANAQKALADVNSSTNVNINNWKLFAQYWTETTYTDEANYDVVNRNVGTILFRIYYRDILADFNEARRLIELEKADGATAEKVKA
ncbi:MAG: SusD/RagB family nutrient-binding outer membrane lipoprotein, partial [Bacteroidetes bacterium]|nr:SusD/RagB family nutrient-binding outer membrane lipoprotein [Bacteroidota bacterium]